MRDKYRRKNQNLADKNNFNKNKASDLTRINDSNDCVRNLFERCLMGYRNSLARIYEITSQLDYRNAANAKSFAAFLVSLGS